MRITESVRDSAWTKAHPTNREGYDDISKAISREEQVKKWARGCKIRLIEEFNPEWKDLYSEINCKDEFGALVRRQAKGASQGDYSFILTDC